MLKLVISTDLTSEIYQQSLQLRREVFITEQGVSEVLEIDKEEESIYFLLLANESPEVTARLKINNQIGKIQRVAVRKSARGLGRGREIMLQVEQWVQKNHLTNCASFST